LKRFYLGAVVALSLAFICGLFLGISSPKVSQTFEQAKYQFRVQLGLPKFWVPLPGGPVDPLQQIADCPDPESTIVLVTGGQSNASNAISNQSATKAGENVYSWFAGNCYIARDPVPGATGNYGSLWPLVGLELAKKTDRPVLLINGAIGSTQVADWVDTRSGYYAALRDRMAEARGAGYEADIIAWHQGETDAKVGGDMALFKQQLQTLTNQLLADMPKARLYMFRASRCIGPMRQDGVAEILRVQTEVAEENDRIVAGMDTDILGNDYRWDMCHLNSLGRAAIIEQIVPELAGLLR
jgi:hypothetical protein